MENDEKNYERKLNEAKIKRITLHFKYTASILLGVSVLAVTLVFYDEKMASTYLTYAGTTLSIVLSVVAILITLIDVAGQKKQVHEIYNTAEELKRLVKNHQTAINNMNELMLNQKKYLKIYNENVENMDSKFRKHMNALNNNTIVNRNEDRDKKVEDENEIITNDNGVTKMNTLSSITNKSELINENFLTQKYKTIKISEPLDEKQEEKINEILSSFKTIKVKYHRDKVSLYSQPIGISPFIDYGYDKERAYTLVKRFLESENLTR